MWLPLQQLPRKGAVYIDQWATDGLGSPQEEAHGDGQKPEAGRAGQFQDLKVGSPFVSDHV